MNKQGKTPAWLFVIVIGMAIGGFHCAKKKVNPVEPGNLNKILQGQGLASSTKTIIGQVDDRVTGFAVSGVGVTVIDTTNGLNVIVGTGTTDLTGKYEIPGIPVDTLLVYFSKIGYIDAALTAFVKQNYWSVEVQTIFLKPVSQIIVIGSAGGNIKETDDEGDVISLDIPSGALDANIGISVTHLQGLEIPSYPPKNHLSFATAHFGPTGTSFKKPVTITVPLPQQMLPGSDLPLYSLEEPLRMIWQDTGIMASVNADGITASAQVTHFSIYSVMPEILVTELHLDTLWEDYEVMPTETGSTTVTYKNEYDKLLPDYIDFPEGADGLNKSTIIYMFEQLHGVSFTNPDTETLYYESPSGLFTVRNTQVLSLEEQMILVQPTRIVNVRKHIKRPMIVDYLSSSSTHDQGGGG
jgi:hypothetical protein